MAQLDTRPQVVDIAHYAGDTLTLQITAPSGLISGMDWTAQIRGNRESGQVDAAFTITPTGTGATLTLSAAESRRLAESGAQTNSARGQVLRYTGAWDVQVAAPGGGDPVTTLAQGTLTIDLDVTREE